jgi:hypothetical protein
MKMQKTIATIIILTGSALTAWVSRDIAFPAILCMLGLLGLRRRYTWDIRPERRVITSMLLLVLAALFALHYRYGGPSGRMGHEAAMTLAWQTVTRYFLASMILMLFLGSPRRLPLSLGLFHVAITVCAGQILLLDDRFIAFRLLEVFSVILAVLYVAARHGAAEVSIRLDARRLPRWVVSVAILVVAANSGWIVSSVLYRHIEALNYVPIWFARQGITLDTGGDGAALVGFSSSGRLSSMASLIQDPTPVLTITADEAPGYLRAEAFEVYRQSEWHDLSFQEAVFPQQGNPFSVYLAGRTNTFRLTDREPADCKSMIIRHEFRFDRTAFTPLGTCSIEAPLNLLLRDEDGIVHAPDLERGKRYQVTYAPTAYRRSLTGAQRSRMLDIPSQLDPRIRQLAKDIFADCRTTTEKINAVVDYFRTRYTYSLELSIPPNRDKLAYFLLEESTGYCEYFASGAAMLLRLADVPTRYVTGFLVTQKDAQIGAWVARNMDAHAWAEAWDREQNRWVVVEATVQEDLGASLAADESGAEDDGAGLMLGRLFQAMYAYGLLGIASWFLASGSIVARSLIPAVLLAGALGWSVRRHRMRGSSETGSSRSAREPALVALHKMLARMDRKVKSAGSQRPLTETLCAFSHRLRAQDPGDGRWARVSDWYLEYADIRYRKTIEADRLAHLQQQAVTLRKDL